MIKLAHNHVAVDFLILDCSGVGAASQKLYFVQVSVQPYQNREAGKRYNVVSHQLGETTPLAHYKAVLNAKNTYYPTA